MGRQEYTLSIFSENHIGILNEITIILTRRQINIESITASESAVKGVHLLTLVVKTTPDMIRKVSKLIEKLIDVLKVFVHTTDEIIDHVVRTHHARIVEVSPEYIVLEKTGHKTEISELLSNLEPYGVLQFARSGRVALTKQVREISSYLKEMDEAHRFNPDDEGMYNRN